MLVTFYFGVALYRQFQPAGARFHVAPSPETTRKAAEARRILQSLENARWAAANLSPKNMRQAEKELPAMRAALLSAHKFFQIPLPPEIHKADIDLEGGMRFAELIIPFLAAGHIEVARTEAANYIQRMEG